MAHTAFLYLRFTFGQSYNRNRTVCGGLKAIALTHPSFLAFFFHRFQVLLTGHNIGPPQPIGGNRFVISEVHLWKPE